MFFPKLAKVKGGYEEFESGFYLKAVSDKGVFGWLFRVWPEEWQVVKQTKVGEEEVRFISVVKTVSFDSNFRYLCVSHTFEIRLFRGFWQIIDEVVWSGDARPSYQEAVDYLLKG